MHTGKEGQTAANGCYTLATTVWKERACGRYVDNGDGYWSCTNCNSRIGAAYVPYNQLHNPGYQATIYEPGCGKTQTTVERYEIGCGKTPDTITGYRLACGKDLSTIESYGIGCGKTAETVEKYGLGCDMTVSTVVGYEAGCGKTEETVEEYRLNCGKTTVTIVGYRLDCGKDNETVEWYEPGCKMTEKTILEFEAGCGKTTETVEGYELSCEEMGNYVIGCGFKEGELQVQPASPVLQAGTSGVDQPVVNQPSVNQPSVNQPVKVPVQTENREEEPSGKEDEEPETETVPPWEEEETVQETETVPFREKDAGWETDSVILWEQEEIPKPERENSVPVKEAEPDGISLPAELWAVAGILFLFACFVLVLFHNSVTIYCYDEYKRYCPLGKLFVRKHPAGYLVKIPDAKLEAATTGRYRIGIKGFMLKHMNTKLLVIEMRGEKLRFALEEYVDFTL